MGLLLVALEECSQSLADCLARQDATYLEHLQRRGELIRRLGNCRMTELPEELRKRLQHCLALGEEARTAAERIRARAQRELLAASQERQVAEGLRALGGLQNAKLDVRA